MCMIHQQPNRRPMHRSALPLLLRRAPRLPQVLVKFNEQQRLILHVGEEVVFADEGEDVGFAEAEEVGEGFAGLAVEDVAATK
jgi:hypothetical protein